METPRVAIGPNAITAGNATHQNGSCRIPTATAAHRYSREVRSMFAKRVVYLALGVTFLGQLITARRSRFSPYRGALEEGAYPQAL